ncbi:hypothetical protein ACFLRY_02625 [Bacteroidota bacterium]
MKAILTAIFVFHMLMGFTQANLDFSIKLEAVSIQDLPGIHSYSFAQHDNKWLIIGGRLDGLHPRQPFAAFPLAFNNTEIYVVDVQTSQFWSTSLSSLPSGISEQLQSTNMSFIQEEDTLYIIGGYAYSATADDHITFPALTTIQVSSVINAIINGDPIQDFFKQINDDIFAVAGGQLGKISSNFYLVGGNRFDGRYNPMGGPTYTQSYSNQIRKFTIDNSGAQLSFDNYSAITDPVHLRRRDYNLLPQIFPDGTHGYTISSGVFQENIDLPFLYPVDINETAYRPVTSFNQYLSNYHSAKSCIYDSVNNRMHSIFFGGISQYYYENGSLIQDDLVPFVKTISCLTRNADSSLQEILLPMEMPELQGASAEFIPNRNLPHYPSEIIKLSDLMEDTVTLGHIYGGIYSPFLNPFSNFQTAQTSADNTIYKVQLIKDTPSGEKVIDTNIPFSKFNLFPNPADTQINLTYNLSREVDVNYHITSPCGKMLKQGDLENQKAGNNHQIITIDENINFRIVFLTLVFDHKYFVVRKVIIG